MSLKPGISDVVPVPNRMLALFVSVELSCVSSLPLARRFWRELVVAANRFLAAVRLHRRLDALVVVAAGRRIARAVVRQRPVVQHVQPDAVEPALRDLPMTPPSWKQPRCRRRCTAARSV